MIWDKNAGFNILKGNTPGANHPLYLRDHTSDVDVFNQVFIKRDYDFLTETEPQIIIDAGAHIGLASLYFASRFPKALIIALEPDDGNFEMLQKNTEPYGNISLLHAALWDKNQELEVFDPGCGSWGYRTVEAGSETPQRVFRNTVKALTVPKIMQDFNLDQIDIFKIDIEGAEKEVFGDTSAWIDQVKALIIELHERFRPGCLRSFYNGSNGFDREWRKGENIYLSRHNHLSPLPKN